MPIILGRDGINRQQKEIYLGIGGVNKKQKEVYQGVGGVNKKIYTGVFTLASIPVDGVTRNFPNPIKPNSLSVDILSVGTRSQGTGELRVIYGATTLTLITASGFQLNISLVYDGGADGAFSGFQTMFYNTVNNYQQYIHGEGTYGYRSNKIVTFNDTNMSAMSDGINEHVFYSNLGITRPIFTSYVANKSSFVTQSEVTNLVIK